MSHAALSVIGKTVDVVNANRAIHFSPVLVRDYAG
jgi:hypothetical protein